MKKLALILLLYIGASASAQEIFPDGTPIPDWFRENGIRPLESLGKRYVITDHGVAAGDTTLLQTVSIQAVIDLAAAEGGGVVVVPSGTFLSGSLFFKPGTHLHLQAGARLKGSDDIADFSIVETRLEGQTIRYFAALINAEGVDGFTLSGPGTIDGNGLRYWRSFWLRRQVNPDCTNLDEMRPRLVYISRSRDVQLSGATLINSPFWTTHLYKCERVKLLNLTIFAPSAPVRAPSSDAVDIDACTDVHIRGCRMSVNDDAVALKGGKGPRADEDPDNGPNRNIVIEDCVYGFCHSALTLGSESIHSTNILLRRCKITNAKRLLWLKMRPDTPQLYENIVVEQIEGDAESFLYIKPWTQFFDLKGENGIRRSSARGVTMRDIRLDCKVVFDVEENPEQYDLTDFTFENLDLRAEKTGTAPGGIQTISQ